MATMILTPGAVTLNDLSYVFREEAAVTLDLSCRDAVENAAANDGSIPDAVPLFPLGKPPPRRLRSVQKLTAFNQQALHWHESAAG